MIHRPRSRELRNGLPTRFAICGLVAVFGAWPTGFRLGPERVYAAQEPPCVLLPISIDYPEGGSIFPPGITSPIHVSSSGERMQIGPIDPDCAPLQTSSRS